MLVLQVSIILAVLIHESHRIFIISSRNRFEKGFTEAPPKAFIGATDQELEAHCVENHEVAWNQARASI